MTTAARPRKAASSRPETTEGLPTGIGKPATRALLAIGVRTLADVAGRTEAELLALHGVGPKAVELLRAALGERGMSFRAGSTE